MLQKIFLLSSFLLLFSPLFAKELYFMPQDQKKAISAIISNIKNTSKTLDIAIYSFTNREISKAIREIAKKGVKIRIVYDKSANQDLKQSTIGYLAKLNNIEVCTLSGLRSKNGKYFGLMHTKMAIIDNKTLILGSANWSKSAFETNYETLLFLEDKDLIKKANTAFKDMFLKCKKY
ncbi:phospholipase D-like domain-containing protein [Helicobacter burdigaliensis]|uniref:phospholipase D-like domain-containing protein n=1 Tax=Helicobacter burdigaliensis TaxID=2315334 RepID=UPI000EF68AB2|nr:phospholipase D-like domain-containing protein [Helicobacter burdigaliensis]